MQGSTRPPANPAMARWQLRSAADRVLMRPAAPVCSLYVPILLAAPISLKQAGSRMTGPSGGTVDASDSKSDIRKGVGVRVPPGAPCAKAHTVTAAAGGAAWIPPSSVRPPHGRSLPMMAIMRNGRSALSVAHGQTDRRKTDRRGGASGARQGHASGEAAGRSFSVSSSLLDAIKRSDGLVNGDLDRTRCASQTVTPVAPVGKTPRYRKTFAITVARFSAAGGGAVALSPRAGRFRPRPVLS